MNADTYLQKRFPSVCEQPHMGVWLTIQKQLGLASATLDAYARALLDYLTFCRNHAICPLTASREHIAAYVHDLATRCIGQGPNLRYGFANATMQQRLVAVRLYYAYLQEEAIRDDIPVKSGFYTPGKGFGGTRRGLLPHYRKLPWIPTEGQWRDILTAALEEPLRNRFMLALAYDAGLRREEVCALQTGDINPTHRLISLRAETTKTRRARVVPYSIPTSQLYAAYLSQRRQLSRERGPLFLSESRRNLAQPLTIWTWSKVVQALARRAGVPQFTTHTLRHLCLTDLARAGWELHEIATFAGHKNLDTTLLYIHLSGRELIDKFARSAESIHTWRRRTMESLL